MVEPTVQFYFNLTVNYKIVLADVAKREREDRELDLQLRRAEIHQKIKNAGGTVNNNTTVTVRTK
jgi:transcription elongation GreA/GreB family factor